MSQRTRERYQIEEQIGTGGMATVYKAIDTVLQRSVALKLLNDQVDPALKQRFQAEAQAVAQLNHPNVVNVYDVGELEGAPYIVMEYVRGTNLKRLIQERGPLGLQEVENVLRQVGAALSYAHRNGLIHCDVKPHNILISPDGRAKLVDFGIAQAQVDRKRKKSEPLYGTPLYIAPEQAAGGIVSPRTDVYGLGLVMWEALTGRPPERPQPDAPVHLPFSEGSLPRHLAEVIRTATATDPNARFASVEDMTRAFLEQKGTDAVGAQATIAYRPIPSAPPPQTRTAAPSSATRTLPQRPVQAPERKRGRRLPLLPLVALLLLLLGLGGAAVAGSLRNLGDNVNDQLAGVVGAGNTPAPSVRTPSLLNLSLSAAQARARQRGLEVEVREYDPESQRPAGTVAEQSPASGEQVEVGGTVEVVVAGPEPGSEPEAPNTAQESTDQPAPRPTDEPQVAAPVPTEAGDAAADPEPEPTPQVERAAGQTVLQMIALDETVTLRVDEGNGERTEVLQPGQYLEARGAYVLVRADPAAELEVTVNAGEQQGTLLEVARNNCDCPITTRDAYIEYDNRPQGASDTPLVTTNNDQTESEDDSKDTQREEAEQKREDDKDKREEEKEDKGKRDG